MKHFILSKSENGKISNSHYSTFGGAFMALAGMIERYEGEGCLVYDKGEYARVIGNGIEIVCQIDEVAA